MEEELLRSIEEIEDRIKNIQKQVRTVISSVQSESAPEEALKTRVHTARTGTIR
jgi:signal transduction histidine kinase